MQSPLTAFGVGVVVFLLSATSYGQEPDHSVPAPVDNSAMEKQIAELMHR
jgi:hypothetical protein